MGLAEYSAVQNNTMLMVLFTENYQEPIKHDNQVCVYNVVVGDLDQPIRQSDTIQYGKVKADNSKK
jgi:hypothetical protein